MLYLDSGFLNIPHLMGMGMPWNILTGGRAIGKTYGTLSWLIQNNIPFVYMRRSQRELDAAATDRLNPFRRLNKDFGWNIRFFKDKDTYIIGESVQDESGRWKLSGDPIAVGVALSTFSNIRGFDGTDYDALIYDEFIPEARAKPIRDEFGALANAYETINRNREITDGKPPLKAILLANANRLDNPIYLGLQIVSKVYRMIQDRQELSIIRQRGLLIVNALNSPISEAKRKTALYRITEGTEFSAMALKNEYIGEADRSLSNPRPISEYRPLCSIGEICVYCHKNNGRYYVSNHRSGSPDSYGIGDVEMLRFRSAWGWLHYRYLVGEIDFESRICEILLAKYLNIC